MAAERAERVGAEAAAAFIAADAGLVPSTDQQLRARGERWPGRDRDRDEVEQHARQQTIEVGVIADDHTVDGTGAGDVETEFQ